MLYYQYFNSPVGELKLVASDQGLVAVLWPSERVGRVRLGDMKRESKHPLLKMSAAQLQEYFAGERQQFDLTLDLRGSDFQKQVWQQLCRIRFGETRSYLALAQAVDRPSAARAVGMANGRNPLSIIIPCHRVIGTNGKLTGFAGGLAAKEFLLRHEGVL